jgi:hypothetical protein
METDPEASLELDVRRRIDSTSEPLLAVLPALGALAISIRSRSSSLCVPKYFKNKKKSSTTLFQ